MCIINANIYMCTARYKITYIHVQSHRPKPKPSPSSVDGSHVNPVTPHNNPFNLHQPDQI